MREFRLDLDELKKEISYIYSEIKECDVLFLEGKVGSGKTTFVSHLAKFLGVEDSVSSPTFSIQNVYDNALYHYDMYQKSFEELFTLGLLECFEEDGLHIVEWGDERLKAYLKEFGHKIAKIEIEDMDKKRVYRIVDA
jgi:tRNA threonylcarbamoyladenosine biosynthesis protein TsaE